MKTLRVEICGGIASGKTTFTSILASAGFCCIYESFASNPFWAAFYSTPSLFNFETEITFTLQHYHQIKKEARGKASVACDYSFLLDYAYAEVGLKGSKLAAFKTVYEEIQKELPPPSLIIFLQCDPEIQFLRIQARRRDEEKGISIDFLTSLNKAIAEQISTAKGHVPLLLIDSAQDDFANDENVKNRMLQIVMRAIGKCR